MFAETQKASKIIILLEIICLMPGQQNGRYVLCEKRIGRYIRIKAVIIQGVFI